MDRLVYVMQQPQHIHGYPVDWYRPAPTPSSYAVMGSQQQSSDYRRGFALGAISTLSLTALAWFVLRETRRLFTGV